MSVRLAGHRPGFRGVPVLRVFACSLAVALVGPALAATVFEKGSSAVLKVSVSVAGNVEVPQNYKDEVVRWSTQRKYQASVKMLAQKPDKMSLAGMAGEDPNAVPEVYTDLAKQAEACGEDQACLMKIAMQMMNNQDLEEAKNAPPRYQRWEADSKQGPIDSKASQVDKWYALFYVSGPEITECDLVAPRLSPESVRIDPNAQTNFEEQSRSALENSARGFVVEIDNETGASTLQVGSVYPGPGDEKCTHTVGGRPETQYRSSTYTMIPIGNLKVPLLLKGSAPGSGIIAKGSQVMDAILPMSQVGGFAVEVNMPLKVKVEWELKAQ